MAYFLSSDLVQWIATSSIPLGISRGHEDHLLAEWFLKAGRRESLSRWISDGGFVDYPRNRGKWAARYTEHTREVHQLKGWHEFVEAAGWFLDETSRGKMDAELNTTLWDFPDEKIVIGSKGLKSLST